MDLETIDISMTMDDFDLPGLVQNDDVECDQFQDLLNSLSSLSEPQQDTTIRFEEPAQPLVMTTETSGSHTFDLSPAIDSNVQVVTVSPPVGVPANDGQVVPPPTGASTLWIGDEPNIENILDMVDGVDVRGQGVGFEHFQDLSPEPQHTGVDASASNSSCFDQMVVDSNTLGIVQLVTVSPPVGESVGVVQVQAHPSEAAPLLLNPPTVDHNDIKPGNPCKTDKKIRDREGNREASRRYREKHKRKLEDLLKEANELEVENSDLKRQHESLKEQVASYKQAILNSIRAQTFAVAVPTAVQPDVTDGAPSPSVGSAVDKDIEDFLDEFFKQCFNQCSWSRTMKCFPVHK